MNKKLLERYVSKRISSGEALAEIKNIKNEMITSNIMNNINNKVGNYLHMISNKITWLSLS